MFKTVRPIDWERDKTINTSTLVDLEAIELPTCKYRVIDRISPINRATVAHLQTKSIGLRWISIAATEIDDRRSNDR